MGNSCLPNRVRSVVVAMLGAIGVSAVSFSADAPAPVAPAAAPPAAVDFATQIKPIFVKHCVSCHGPLKQRAGIRLDTGAEALRGGKGGAIILPHKPAESALIKAVLGLDDLERMPKDAAPLSDTEIALLKAWVEQGARIPKDEAAAAAVDPSKHWSFKAPVKAPLPAVKNAAWSKHPIDAFLAAEHEKRGLSPVGPAPRHVLLRRVYLDLIGLPPTPDELNAFLGDSSPDAYEKVVDQLFASPRYGERWGRHWMDVWRYSDWYGYGNELRNSQRHIWRWRDWIIESLNADKPYDRMIVEMLAADEAFPDDPGALRATGFLARNYYKFNRNVWLDSIVEHTSKAFLGLTINCARCHEHKYDPIEHEDYYALRAIFEPHQIRLDRVPGQPNTDVDGLARVFDADANVQTFLFARGNEKHPVKDKPIAPAIPQSLANVSAGLAIQPVNLPVAAYYPALQPAMQQEFIATAKKSIANAQAALDKAKLAETEAKRKLAEFEAKEKDKPVASTTPAEAPKPPADKEAKPKVEVAGKPQAADPRGKGFIADTFAKTDPQTWHAGDGEWEHANGRLLQKKVGNTRCALTSKANHPRDFTAEFRFKITGGEQWKSVGISFDASNKDQDTIYLSAHAGEPKVQISQTRNGQSTYPAEAKKALPIKVGQEHTLRIDVRDRLVNVTVDGQLALVHALPHNRRDGKLQVWTYDASAEFIAAKVHELSSEFALAQKVGEATAAAPTPGGPSNAATPVVVTTREALDFAVRSSTSSVDVAQKQLSAAEAELVSVEARIAADNARYANPPAAGAPALISAAASKVRSQQLLAADAALADAQKKLADAEFAVKSGDAKQAKPAEDLKKNLPALIKKREEAQAALAKTDGDYTPLLPIQAKTSTGRRLALANWIASKKNPLTARVAVNHIWMRHFGQPLVPTVFDFGFNGKPPTHPALLDYLAVDLMENSWSTKRLHRLIVTSQAYRMASSGEGLGLGAKGLGEGTEARRHDGTKGSGPNPESRIPNPASADPDNLFLWHMNVRRLEAEAVRDSLIHIAGKLDLTAGGPELDHNAGLNTYRRSVYYRHALEKQMTFLAIFDAASPVEGYRRATTVVPQQALALANSSLALDMAKAVAADLSAKLAEAPPGRARADSATTLVKPAANESDAAFIRAAYLRVLCREPSAEEIAACVEFLAEEKQPQRGRENLVHVLINHHEFVTIR